MTRGADVCGERCSVQVVVVSRVPCSEPGTPYLAPYGGGWRSVWSGVTPTVVARRATARPPVGAVRDARLRTHRDSALGAPESDVHL